MAVQFLIRILSNYSHFYHAYSMKRFCIYLQRIKFEDIVTKCPECPNCHFKSLDIPYVVEWYLENSGPISDTFSCLVDINCTSGQNQQPNVITVDELPLRQEDRRPVEVSISSFPTCRCIFHFDSF